MAYMQSTSWAKIEVTPENAETIYVARFNSLYTVASKSNSTCLYLYMN